jgi:hypothetical protein
MKYTFTEPEVRELGRALAREDQILFDLRSEKASAAASLNEQIKVTTKRVAELVEKINRGFELRAVEVIAVFEKPRPGMKTFVRIDNGEEVRTEAMTMEELQQSFGFAEPGT